MCTPVIVLYRGFCGVHWVRRRTAMRIHSIFAVKFPDTSEIKESLQDQLGLSFVLHESSYLGEYWLSEDTTGSVVSIGSNKDPMYAAGDPEDEKYFESAFSEFGAIVSITALPQLETEIVKAVSCLPWQAVLVRRTEIE